ncbi:Polysaccharide pyruvyl transferase [Kandleria vitulina]|uniref:polysaccharide pyruvyl transferase family protein n=1 Tax=Kandleria vitulina TaxID=1630 RepID=UPI0008D0C13A|nr:polysaccharide pyruvyl transferase family protein [Kandleria vitulina]SEI99035.1 Polysaccharide pyruvyl transferase [Kandleria vitulina]
MEIGIITFQDANNYGAVLQAYALNKKINEFESCEIINYNNSYFHKNENSKNIKNIIFNMFYRKSITQKNEEFEKFRKQYMLINNEYIDTNSLKKLNEKYDCFISGSDQVWNLDCSGNNDSYFLDFVIDDKKKNSFSASFGSTNPHLDDYHIDLVKRFNNVSVREKSGVEFLKKHDINSCLTLDPVFLLTKEEWLNVTSKVDDNYILVYEVINGMDMIEFAKKLSKKTGYKIKLITSSNKPFFGAEVYRNVGPLTWLSLMSNSKFIITNSFHGLAFSLLFNKEFFIELLKNSKTNNRMQELLNEFNLTSRVMDINNEDKYEEVDWESINNKICLFRDKSIEYIKTVVGRY